ncbi:hypothetical protein C8A03DRAFT_12209 [Achaetomium macrosporum]|uniref:Uncharacterized protein n=1 Tax=Achaetomium macrosporum TaxID=79813 RepID=A0AAN7CG95_9PEZI|nr:hypothetical protein C8A03DRAFT_12209 [Achaetomium macrosporum]
MSAVKNLRAMFEQKGETSPPDRGRSPGIPHGSDSPRPLSKVRTSFVAIEKDGRIGLQREGSQDSISALRKHSGDSNAVTTPTAGTPTAGSEKSNPFEGVLRSPAKMSLRTQPIFESPKADTGKSDAAVLAQEPQSVEQDTAPGTDAQSNVSTPNEAAAKEAASPGSAGSPQGEAVKANGAGSGNEPKKTAGQEASKPATRTTKSAPKPLSVSSGSKPATKAEKSPTAQKGPRTPPATSAHHPATKKTPEKKAQPPENPVTPQTTAGPSKPAGPSSIKKPPSLQSSPAHTPFVKPKPKSPTRPVKLPPSLTTHTASSGSKVNAPRQSLSPSSADPHGRPASRASASATGATNKPAAAKGLRRQNSTINRPRPSLGPPPKQSTKDHPPPKREKEVDQSFLARMMRPTQASASKVAERVHTSPPRKAAAAPKKAATAKPIKKTVPKSAGTTAPSKQPQSLAAGTDKTTADADHATAVEVDGTANSAAAADQESPIDAPVAEERETAGDQASLTQASKAAVAGDQPVKDAKPQHVASPGEPGADGSVEKAEAGVAAGEGVSGAETATTEEKGDAPEMTAAY